MKDIFYYWQLVISKLCVCANNTALLLFLSLTISDLFIYLAFHIVWNYLFSELKHWMKRFCKLALVVSYTLEGYYTHANYAALRNKFIRPRQLKMAKPGNCCKFNICAYLSCLRSTKDKTIRSVFWSLNFHQPSYYDSWDHSDYALNLWELRRQGYKLFVNLLVLFCRIVRKDQCSWRRCLKEYSANWMKKIIWGWSFRKCKDMFKGDEEVYKGFWVDASGHQ